jgi:enoyl-[acyl-carrier protein] reductase II
MKKHELFDRGTEFLGSRYPIICGAMTWISDSVLVSSVCNAGGFGCLASGNAPADILSREIARTRELTSNPFGVNVITVSPAYRSHLDVLCENPVPVVIFAGSIPKEQDVERIKSSGSRVMCFAPTRAMASRLVRFGVDGLILEGTEAGGHIGPVSLTVLLQEILFDDHPVPIFVGGGLALGSFCAHLLMMGAAGVQLGTRFAVSRESCAHPDFKAAFLKAEARDAISTSQFDARIPVIPVRTLRNRGTADFGRLQLELIGQLNRGEITRTDGQMRLEEFWLGGLRRAVQEGDVDYGSMMAGQSVGLVKSSQSVEEIIQELVRDMEAEIDRVRSRLK